MIVAGVDHAGRDCAHEHLPYKDFVGNPDMSEPAGKRFPDFLTTEVMPLVNGQYRALRGQPNTGIGGPSYGGVATLYALPAKPGEFGYWLIESPTRCTPKPLGPRVCPMRWRLRSATGTRCRSRPGRNLTTPGTTTVLHSV